MIRLLNGGRVGFIRIFTFISILSLAPLLLAACGTSNQPTPTTTNVFRFPWFEPPDSIDPAVAFQGYPITINLFQGLVSRENPHILLDAQSTQSSSDSRIWTFHLKPDLRWSNGQPLTADDYVYGIKRYIDPKTASPLAFFSYYIKGAQAANEGKAGLDSVAVQAVDVHTLRIEFVQPIGYAPALLTLWGFDPVYKPAIDKYGTKWIEPQNIVTNGPFTIASWVHKKEMVLVPNPHYEGQKPSVSKVVLSLIQQPFQTDDGMALRAFENNEVDYADVPFSQIDRLKQDATLSKELHFASKLRPVWINFDTTNKPWSDPRVRQAFSLAIDRNLLAQTIFKGEYKSISSLVPPSMLPTNVGGNGVTFDVKEAQSLLAAAGYPNGRGFPAFTLQAPSNSTNQLLAPALQQEWSQNLGITNMKIELLESKTFDQLVEKTYKTHHFDLTIGGLTADFLDPADYFDTWLSTRQEFYNNHWVNAQYDQIVNEAHQVADQSERSTLYTEANSILMQDLPAMPLWLDGWAYVLSPHVAHYGFAFSNIEPDFQADVMSGK